MLTLKNLVYFTATLLPALANNSKSHEHGYTDSHGKYHYPCPTATYFNGSDPNPTWSYKPNYDLGNCTFVGCCGDPAQGKQSCGPEKWQFINANTNLLCTQGQQSPINFQTVGPDKCNFRPISEAPKTKGDKKKIKTSKKKFEGEIELIPAGYEIVYPDEGKPYIMLLGHKWDLVQFHFHPSEHTINGFYYPLEIHLVHSRIDSNGVTRLLVLGVHLTVADDSKVNPFFAKVLKTGGSHTPVDRHNPYDVLPKDKSYWHYKGSLTTPNCRVSPNNFVNWFVFKNPVEMTLCQASFLTDYFLKQSENNKPYLGQTNRPLQPIISEVFSYNEGRQPEFAGHGY